MCLGVLTSSQIQPQSLPLWSPSICLYVWCAQESSPVHFLPNPTPGQGGTLKPSGGGASLHPDQKSPIWNIKHSFDGFTFSRHILIRKLNCTKDFHLKQNYSSRELRVRPHCTGSRQTLRLHQFDALRVSSWQSWKLKHNIAFHLKSTREGNWGLTDFCQTLRLHQSVWRFAG